MGNTNDPTAIYLTQRREEHRAQSHEEHVQGITQINDRARTVVGSSYFWDGGQDCGAGNWGEETAEGEQSYDDEFSGMWESVVDFVWYFDVGGVGLNWCIVCVRDM